MKKEEISGYELTRRWFNFSFENQEKVTPSHTALYLWLVELNNRMGWVKNFAAPASQSMAAVGLKSYNSYKKVFDDLALSGFIEIVSPAKNQFTACIIALSNFDKAPYKALDKALTMQASEHCESTQQSIDSINKPLNQETINQETLVEEVLSASEDFENQIPAGVRLDFLKTTEEEKEKGSAQKEKELPTWDVAASTISDTQHWRNVMEHQNLTEDARRELFKRFYEMKTDNYRIRYPTKTDMAQNFYFWTEQNKNRQLIQKLKESAAATIQPNHSSNTKNYRTAGADKRAGLRNLAQQSAGFLQAANGFEHQDYPNG